MKATLMTEQEPTTWVLVFDTGDEVMAELDAFARRTGLQGSHFTGIGAFRDVEIAFFDWERREYDRTAVDEQVEVLSLVGDVALHHGKPKVHTHVVLGARDGSTRGGHLMSAHVRPTLELVLTEMPRALRRAFDERSGLALIELDAGKSV